MFRGASRILVLAVPGVLLPGLLLPTPARGQTGTDILLVERGPGASTWEGARVTTVVSRPGYDNQPAFTPDGKALLYTQMRDGQTDVVWHWMDSGEAHLAVQTSESEYSPTLVPDPTGALVLAAVRVEADGRQRLWWWRGGMAREGRPRYTHPEPVLPDLAPVGYYAWPAPDRVALFVLGEPHWLAVVDRTTGQVVRAAEDIGRSLIPAGEGSAVGYLRRGRAGEWWVEELDLETGESRVLVPALPGSQDHVRTADGSVLMARGTAVYRWDRGVAWTRILDLEGSGARGITRLALHPRETHLAVVVEDLAPR